MKLKQIIGLCFVVCLLAGCGGTSEGSYNQAIQDNYDVDGFASTDFYAAYDVGMNYSAESMEVDSSPKASEGTDVESLETGVINEEKLVYRGNIEVDTLSFESTVDAFRDLVSSYDGFVESEYTSDNNGWSYWYDDNDYDEKRYEYTATVRIPSLKFQDFFSETEGLGDVRSSSSSVENITQQYSTTATTLEIYQTKYDRYIDLLAQAETVEDMLAIERELTDIETKLAQYKTSLSTMDTDVAYSYLDVKIRKVEKRSEIRSRDTFRMRLVETCQESWTGVLSFLENSLFWLIRSWWYIAFIILLGILVKKVLKKASVRTSKRVLNKPPKNQRYVKKEDTAKNDDK